MTHKVWIFICLFLVLIGCCYSQNKESSTTLFGAYPPGDTAVLFAPQIFKHPEGYHAALIFTKDFEDVYFSPMTNYGELNRIRNLQKNESIEKITFPSLCDAGDPFLSPDNKRLYFLSFQPLSSDSLYRERIWYSEIANGTFSTPQVVDETVYAHATHWQFSVADNYNLYFISEIISQENQDIYLSKYIQGEYLEPEMLPGQINTEGKELCPYISPDEEYLIFSRSGEGTEKTDLFISYRKGSIWTDAYKLPNAINSKAHDLCPVVSPDGKYLFFISNREGVSKIYWVSANFIHEMR